MLLNEVMQTSGQWVKPKVDRYDLAAEIFEPDRALVRGEGEIATEIRIARRLLSGLALHAGPEPDTDADGGEEAQDQGLFDIFHDVILPFGTRGYARSI